MYESFFHFTDRPFSAAPLPSRFFPAQSIEQARQTITRAVERSEGPAILIGPAGTGKSLLLQVLASQLRKKYRVVALTAASLSTRRALLQNILFVLDLPYRGMDEGELRLSLIDFLQSASTCPGGILLLVDEAHVLSVQLLEEIRMVTELVVQGESRVRLVLAGHPALEEQFTDPKLESFNQRLAARCYLQGLTREETSAYIASQITAVGGQLRQIMTDDALHAVHRASDGTPRLINQICDHALMLASLGGRKRLDAAGIEEAWADLQQLPLPWQESQPSAAAAGGIIEFGELKDAEPDNVKASRETDAAELMQSAADLQAESQLEEIQLKVAQIDSEGSDATEQQQLPAGQRRCEVELQFHTSHDPFNEPFEEEEVVIDHYATLDATVLKQRPHVYSAEGHDIAQALAGENRHVQAEPAAAGAEAHESWQAVVAPAWTDDQQAVAQVISSEQSGLPDQVVMPNQVAEVDDGDLIIVEEDSQWPTADEPMHPGARRQDYRQLFARLRRG